MARSEKKARGLLGLCPLSALWARRKTPPAEKAPPPLTRTATSVGPDKAREYAQLAARIRVYALTHTHVEMTVESETAMGIARALEDTANRCRRK